MCKDLLHLLQDFLPPRSRKSLDWERCEFVEWDPNNLSFDHTNFKPQPWHHGWQPPSRSSWSDESMRGYPGSQQFAHFMIGSALLKFIMFKNIQYWMTILTDAYLILDDLLGGIYGSAPPVIGALLLSVTHTTAGWLGQTLSHLGTTTSHPIRHAAAAACSQQQ